MRRRIKKPNPKLAYTMCYPKMFFASQDEALRYIEGKEFRSNRAYSCPFCLGWHLTSKAA